MAVPRGGGGEFNPLTPLLGVCLKVSMGASHRDSCIPISITELLMIAMIWKLPTDTPTDKQIKKMGYM